MAIVGRTAQPAEINDTNLTGSLSCPLPPDMQYGDVAICVYIGSGNPANCTPPAGWTQFIAPVAVPDASQMAAWWRIHTEASPITTNPSVGYVNAARHSIIVQAYGGVSLSNPMDVAPSQAIQASVTSIAAPSITTVTPGAMLISADLIDSSSAATTKPATMTLVKDVSGGSQGRGGALAEELRATAGATGTRTWTTPAALGMGVWLAALRPSTVLTVSGSITSTGTVRRSALKRWVGSTTPAGAWSYIKVVEKFLSGMVAPAGTFAKLTVKALSGAAAPAGTFAKLVVKGVFAGVVTAVGTSRRSMIRLFTGSVTPTATVALMNLGRAAGKTGVAVMRVVKAGHAYLRRRVN